MSKFCGKCGALLGDNKKFCSKCGNNLNEISTETISENDESIYDNNIYNNVNNGVSEKLDKANIQNNSKIVNRSKSSCVLSIVLSILFFIFSLTTIFVGVTRMYFDEDNLKNVISNIDLNEINIDYNGDYISIEDFILNNISDNCIYEYNITTDKIGNVLNNSDISKLIENFVVKYVSYIAHGEKSKYLTEDGIINILESTADVIYELTGYKLNETDYEDIRYELDNGNMKFLIASNIEDTLGFNPIIIQMLLSIITFIILIIVSILLLILILKVNNWKFKYLFKHIGITIIILGTILVIVSLIGLIISLTSEIYLLSMLLRSLLISLLIAGVITLIVGVVMFVLYKLLAKKEQI